jgi:transposase
MGSDITRVLFGMDDFEIVASEVDADGLLIISIRRIRLDAPCPYCGEFSDRVKQRTAVKVRDRSCFDRQTRLVWLKRRFRCIGCPNVTFTETSPNIRPRARISCRMKTWIATQIKTRSAASVATESGLSWPTVWRVTKIIAAEAIEARKVELVAAGFDETTFLRRCRQFTTNIVCLDTGDLIDMVKGRSGPVLADWITNNPDIVSTLTEVVIDPFAGYHRAITDHLDGVTETVDRFHIERLGTQMVTDVRQRQQQALCGHRGRRGDPLYDARSALRRNWTRLRSREWAHLVAVLETDQDTITAWNVAQQLADIYRQSINGDHARRNLNVWFQLCANNSHIPEIVRLATTIDRWKVQFLNYWHNRRTNARSEARNLGIKQIKRTGRGYRNFENYRLRNLWTCH